jgi:transposase
MRAKARADLQVMPMLANESLYAGVDIGKFKHIAGFVSTTLLARFKRFEGCPVLVFEQSREGFCALVDRMRAYVPLQQAYVLLERTGHYHRALEQYLLDMEISVFVIHVQRRPTGMLKSD